MHCQHSLATYTDNQISMVGFPDLSRHSIHQQRLGHGPHWTGCLHPGRVYRAARGLVQLGRLWEVLCGASAELKVDHPHQFLVVKSHDFKAGPSDFILKSPSGYLFNMLNLRCA